MTEPTATPATSAGTTQPAGAGVSDDEMSSEVAEQTSSDLAVEEAFQEEADGAASDVEAAKGGTPAP
ncbi:MAG: hypothetical protein JWN17_3035 [Frankiales bacterium]|nr:hypothetical protein [Frankiales bacterium]